MSPCPHVDIPPGLIADGLVPTTPPRGDGGLVRSPEVDLRDRYRGTLLAGAIGDALGRPAEGRRPDTIRARYGILADFVPWRGWKGGPVGTITDDTQLTMEVARSIVEAGGCLDPEDLAARFVRWLPVGRGKGRATTAAVRRLADGVPWYEAGEPSAGNGAAMRAAPIGLRHPLDLAAIRVDAALSAVVTHRDPMAVVSAVAQAFAVAYLLHRPTGTLDPDAFLDAMDVAIGDLHDPGYPERRRDGDGTPVRLADRIASLRSMLDLPVDEAFARLHNGAFVLESLPAALWCFLTHAEDPEAAIVVAANQGYDADTVAAMAGNLSGAYHGEHALPRRRLDDLEFADELRALADDLHAFAIGGRT